jgi:hypothetical protein
MICACGCGQTSSTGFVVGHDIVYRGRLLALSAQGDQAAQAELRVRGWVPATTWYDYGRSTVQELVEHLNESIASAMMITPRDMGWASEPELEPEPEIVSLLNRTFGVEIEVIGLDRATFISKLHADEGMEIIDTGYNHEVYETWKITTDSSIEPHLAENGFYSAEIVSPILRGSAGLREVRAICRVLTQLGVKVNSSCGLHVHVGIDDLRFQQLKNIGLLYVKNQLAIDSVLPPSRRSVYDNQYCRKIYLDDIFDSTEDNEGLDSIRGGYGVLNFDTGYPTLEFRQHSGSTDAQKIISWIKFCLCMVQFGAWIEEVETYTDFSALAVAIGLDRSARNYYTKRVREFGGVLV